MDVRVIGHHDFKRPFVSKPDAFKIVPDDVLGAIGLGVFVGALIFWPWLPHFFRWLAR